jgi:hypothetical protein
LDYHTKRCYHKQGRIQKIILEGARFPIMRLILEKSYIKNIILVLYFSLNIQIPLSKLNLEYLYIRYFAWYTDQVFQGILTLIWSTGWINIIKVKNVEDNQINYFFWNIGYVDCKGHFYWRSVLASFLICNARPKTNK